MKNAGLSRCLGTGVVGPYVRSPMQRRMQIRTI